MASAAARLLARIPLALTAAAAGPLGADQDVASPPPCLPGERPLDGGRPRQLRLAQLGSAVQRVPEVNKASLLTSMQSNQRGLLVAFWAPWCSSSQWWINGQGNPTGSPLEAIASHLQEQGGPAVLKFDVVGNPQPPGFHIPHYPTFYRIEPSGARVEFKGRYAPEEVEKFAMAGEPARPAQDEGLQINNAVASPDDRSTLPGGTGNGNPNEPGDMSQLFQSFGAAMTRNMMSEAAAAPALPAPAAVVTRPHWRPPAEASAAPPGLPQMLAGLGGRAELAR